MARSASELFIEWKRSASENLGTANSRDHKFGQNQQTFSEPHTALYRNSIGVQELAMDAPNTVSDCQSFEGDE